MKTNFTIISIISCLIISCSTVKKFTEKTDLKKENLKGIVKKTNLYQDSVLLNTTEYDKNGFKTKSVFFNHNGELRNEISYEYINGFLSSETSKFPDGKVYKTEYKRDSKNRVSVKTSIYPNNKIDSKIEYEYDSKNRVIKRTYNPTKGRSYCYTFEYDNNYRKEIHCTYGLQYYFELSNGLVTKKSEYKSDGKIEQGYKYEYNEKNDQILETVLWKEKIKEKNTTNYLYDIKNNWTTKTTIYSSGGKSKIDRTLEYY